MADTEHLERRVDTRAAARALAPEIAARAEEIETARRLPSDLAQSLAAAGVFRMVTPDYLGGLELTPRQIVETVEVLATADASTGWCAMIGATTALNAAYMDRDTAQEIYGDP
ncbi:MAG: acyl-CoA dehydrogenase family protein, partial [Pseudomonadota bacterium]